MGIDPFGYMRVAALPVLTAATGVASLAFIPPVAAALTFAIAAGATIVALGAIPAPSDGPSGLCPA